MTIELLLLSMVTSAIIGLPMMSVVAPVGSLAILAWSSVTAMTSGEVCGRAGDAPNASANAIASKMRDNIESPFEPVLGACAAGRISLEKSERTFNARRPRTRQAALKDRRA